MARKRLFRDTFRFPESKESLKNAVQGIVYLFFYHRNMRIIFLMGIAAFLLGVYTKLKGIELMVLCLTISLVFIAEIFNTAIELIIDMLTDKYHALIKIIKDIAAAVVLIACLNALAIGYALFFRRIFKL
jgi:diacylglycerol kinase (ATP)